ncbi:uncharacterized protein J8A68_004760 [[Candida] subhashii]|uniref:FAD-binding FR-type domain-containing protein n=1 Tax=[Candida] subhashii TaxID=561895 RepID=A0A8J5QIP6_9ASCO|nr:uncharacterized protein J8A68_004760 [[Candida] subhashii]KAG7661702.1 hypothetical protein J8A68_004760 [[Candida] subhashii]
MRTSVLVSILAASIASVNAIKEYTQLTIALSACEAYITLAQPVCMAGKKANKDFDCYCNTKPGFGTLADCFVKGFDDNDGIIKDFAKTCNMTVADFHTKYDAIKDHLFKPNTTETETTMDGGNGHMKRDKHGGGGHGGGKGGNGGGGGGGHGGGDTPQIELSKVPLKLDYTDFHTYKDAYEMNYGNFNYAMKYGSALVGYWGIILVMSIIANFWTKLFPRALSGRLPSMYRKYITLPATFGRKKNEAISFGFGGFFDGLMPSRLETFYVVVFVFLTGLFSALHIKHIPGNPIQPDIRVEIAHTIADRTGVMVCFLIPLLILFGGRNNFLQWLTGWKYSDFVMYHRWISRVAALLVIVHGITFSASDIASGRYSSRMAQEFMIWGTVACVCGGIILFQAMLFFRRKCYEVFFIIHIVLALFFMIGAWFHLSDQGYEFFMYAALGVWAFERLLRLVRLVSFGMPLAKVTLIADETLKVVVPKPRYWKSIPGGHAFITFMRPTAFWQQHPFTFTTEATDDSITFYVKVKAGETKKLYNKLVSSPGCTTTMRVLVEGPYGEPSDGRRADNVVFVAGGNGIPGMYSECFDLATRSSTTQSIKLIWIIRQWKSLAWFKDELKALQDTKVQTEVYITRPDEDRDFIYGTSTDPDSTNSSIEEKESNQEKKSDTGVETKTYNPQSDLFASLPNVVFKEGRPSMEAIVESEIDGANGSIAFVTCGHPMMVDDLRHSVGENLGRGGHRVDFYEQLQTWA